MKDESGHQCDTAKNIIRNTLTKIDGSKRMNRRASFIPSPQPVRARLNLQRSTSRGRNRGGTQVERINPYWSDSLFSARLFSRKYLRGIIRNTEVSTGLPADPVETQNTRQVLSVGQACLDNDPGSAFPWLYENFYGCF